MTNLAIREARRRSRSTAPTSEVGFCKREVRECLSFNVGPIVSRSADAAECWHNAEHKHFTTDPADVPRGAPAFWLGGSEGHGHVTLGTGHGGNYTMDLIRNGFFDLTGIANIAKTWHTLRLVGWAEDYDGVRVWRDGHPVITEVRRTFGRVELDDIAHEVVEVRGEVGP